MSISAEYAEEHKKSPAVLCCRAEEEIVLSHHNLEDPEIFDDLVDQGLLKLDDCITIEEALGAKLLKTCDSLTPLTKDLVQLSEKEREEKTEEKEEGREAGDNTGNAVNEEKNGQTFLPIGQNGSFGGCLKIHIGEGKGIDIQIPVGALGISSATSAAQGAFTSPIASPLASENGKNTENEKKEE